jgi:hypothetical protein
MNVMNTQKNEFGSKILTQFECATNIAQTVEE